MSAHQNWLEAPYVNAAAEGEAYEAWLEERPDLDPEDDHWDEFEQEMQDLADDADAERGEAARDDWDW